MFFYIKKILLKPKLFKNIKVSDLKSFYFYTILYIWKIY